MRFNQAGLRSDRHAARAVVPSAEEWYARTSLSRGNRHKRPVAEPGDVARNRLPGHGTRGC